MHDTAFISGSHERQVETLAMLTTTYSSIPLVRSAFHQHKFHLSDVYCFCRNYSGRVFLKNDGLVFYEGKQFTVELHALLLSLNRFGQYLVNRIVLSNRQFSDAERRSLM